MTPRPGVECSGPVKSGIFFSLRARDSPFRWVRPAPHWHSNASRAQLPMLTHSCRLVQESRVPSMSALTRVRAQVLDRLGYLRGLFECWGERYARRLVCHLLGKDMQVPPCPDIPLRPTEVPCYNWLRREAPRGW